MDGTVDELVRVESRLRLLYYPLAYAGSGVSWYAHMSTHAGVLIAASVAGLFPYWLLRPLIKPLPGFGGY